MAFDIFPLAERQYCFYTRLVTRNSTSTDRLHSHASHRRTAPHQPRPLHHDNRQRYIMMQQKYNSLDRVVSDFIKSINKTLQGQQSLTFALRHRITVINLHCHHLATKTEFSGLLKAEHSIQVAEAFYPWIRSGKIPIVGFNPAGILLSLREADLCRAFDSYDLVQCDRAGSGYCEQHLASEQWWLPGEEVQLTQSTMFQFYLDLDNAEVYSEQELEEMLERFWKSMDKYRRVSSAISVQKALELFNIKDQEHLRSVGSDQLRRLFYKKSLQAHPDQGGEVESFIHLKDCYQTLQSFLKAS